MPSELPVGEEEQRFRAAVEAASTADQSPNYDEICRVEKIHPSRLAWLIQRLEVAEKKPFRAERPGPAAEHEAL